MVTVYSECESSRLSYTLEVIFRRCLGTDFQLTHDWEHFSSTPASRINYSLKKDSASLCIVPHVLLFETHVEEREIDVEQWKDIPAFFRTQDQGEIPFDVFAASFYLLSRYEEYASTAQDEHGRFPSSASLAFLHGFLERPVVNEWAKALGELLKQSESSLVFAPADFQFISTIDVDMAYCYKHKGLHRTLGGLAREVLTLDLGKAKERLRVLRGKQQDPFDNFDYQRSFHREHPIQRVYFILLGEHGKFDKNIRHDKPPFMDLVQRLADENPVGIHPSYGSNEQRESVKEEIHRLETITGKTVKYSRQHFLKLDIRETLPLLDSLGIQAEYSMGYSDLVGFRAGICHPYPFFNLPKNESSAMLLYPFAVMDVSLMRFMKLSPVASSEKIKALLETVKSFQGVFVSIFHNESLSDRYEWTGWRSVYEEMVKLAVQNYDPVPAQ